MLELKLGLLRHYSIIGLQLLLAICQLQLLTQCLLICCKAIYAEIAIASPLVNLYRMGIGEKGYNLPNENPCPLILWSLNYLDDAMILPVYRMRAHSFKL
jgi:hypothetical protein